MTESRSSDAPQYRLVSDADIKAICGTDRSREMCCRGYDCECRNPGDTAFIAGEQEARRIEDALLALPVAATPNTTKEK